MTEPTPADYLALPFSSSLSAERVRERLLAARGWEGRLKILTEFAREFPPLPTAMRTDAHLVQGCDARTWLAVTVHEGRIHAWPDSEARIVRGLAIAVLAQLVGRAVEAAGTFDADAALHALGLEDYLSASRRNGLKAVVCAVIRSVAV